MPLLWLSLAFCSGIIFAKYLPDYRIVYLIGSAVGCLIGSFESRFTDRIPFLSKWRKISPVSAGYLLAAFLLGAARFCFSLPDWNENDLAWYNGRKDCHFIAQIVKSPEKYDENIRLTVEAMQKYPALYSSSEEPKPLKGKALIHVKTADIWQYGDVIELEGSPETPFESDDFSYKEYLAQRGIHSTMYYPRIHLLEHQNGNAIIHSIYSLRESLYSNIQSMFPQPEASLLSGILLGIEKDIPDNVQNDFRNTGTSHIIAISGFNIAILAGLFTVMFNYLLRDIWKSLLVTSILLTGYTVLVGSDPAVVRAAIMGIIGLFGRTIGRKQSGANSLCFVAALMCLFNPLLPWDISFQLSFSATFGLVYFADPLIKLFVWAASHFIPEESAMRLSGPAGEYFIFTIAAQITTLPVIVTHFHQISMNSLLANLLILPAQPAIMVLGGISVILSMLFPLAGQIVAYFTWIPLTYTIHIVEWIANNLPGIITINNIDNLHILLYCLGVLLLPNYFQQIKVFLQPQIPIGITVLTGALAIFLWQSVVDLPDQHLHLKVATDSDGHGFYLLTTPTGRYILIGLPENSRQTTEFLDSHLPLLSRQLDVILLNDDLSGREENVVEMILRYSPVSISYQNEDIDEETVQYITTMTDQETRFIAYENGQTIDLGDQGELIITADNKSAVPVVIRWKNLSILIPGGIQENINTLDVIRAIHPCSIILLNNEDQKSKNMNFYTSLHPNLFISTTSCPDFIKENHLQCIELNTSGWLSLTSDGENLWLEAEKSNVE